MEEQQLCPFEVCLQYPTYSVWKKASEVTLQEAEEHKIIGRRRGNSEVGYLIDLTPSGNNRV